jgi:hypothetical protein
MVMLAKINTNNLLHVSKPQGLLSLCDCDIRWSDFFASFLIYYTLLVILYILPFCSRILLVILYILLLAIEKKACARDDLCD